MKIIWLKSGPLHPLDTGGKIRTYNMLCALKRSHEVEFIALCPPTVPEWVKHSAAEYCHRSTWIPWREAPKHTAQFYLQLAVNFTGSRLPFAIDKYRSPEMAKVIDSRAGSRMHDLIVCDFLMPSVNCFIRNRHPATPMLLFQHNVESLIWKRLTEAAEAWVKRRYFRDQWQRMLAFERDRCSRFDAVVGVSDEDCETMRREFGVDNVLGAVPTGVDSEYFAASEMPRKPCSLVFLGSMDWMANIDAMHYFVGDIWGEVRKKFPVASLTIVGRNPSAGIKAMEKPSSGVRVTGTVDDVRPFLNESAAMIVPLRVGGGTRIKIFEGMSTGIPVISTRIGAEGLPVTDGSDILLADNPHDFVARITDLFQDPDRAARMGAAGRLLVKTRFGWDGVSRMFEGYCHQACEKGSRRA